MLQWKSSIVYRIVHLDIAEWLDKLCHDSHSDVVNNGVLKHEEENQV